MGTTKLQTTTTSHPKALSTAFQAAIQTPGSTKKTASYNPATATGMRNSSPLRKRHAGWPVKKPRLPPLGRATQETTWDLQKLSRVIGMSSSLDNTRILCQN